MVGQSRWGGRLLPLITAALGALLVFQAAQPYPGVSVDSGEYLAVSEGLTEGRGFTMPYVNFDEPWRVVSPGERIAMVQFPPLYPAALAALQEGFGLSSLDAARLVGSLAFFLTILLVIHVVYRHTQRISATLIAGGLLIAPDLLIAHAMSWSESLMLLGLAGGLFGISTYLDTGRRGYLIVAGFAGAFAALARLAGIALFAGLALALLIGLTAPLGRRLRVATAFAALSSVPLVVWLVRNAFVYGAPSEKTVGLHPPGSSAFIQATRTIGNWVFPGHVMALVAGVALLVVLVALGRSTVSEALRGRAGPVALTCATVGLAYVAFVLLSRTFLDQNIPLDARILAPVQILAVTWICSRVHHHRNALVRNTALVALAALGLITVGRGILTTAEFSTLDVASYTNDRWRSSETLNYVATVPGDTMIISNAVDAIWVWHDRPTQLIPSRENLYSGSLNEKYPDQVQQLLSATRCRRALVVFFNKPTRKPRRIIEERLVIELGLEPIERLSDGIVYSVDEPRGMCVHEPRARRYGRSDRA